MAKIKAPIEKSAKLSTLKELSNTQFASLYGFSKNFVRDNDKFISDLAAFTGELLARNDRTIASSTPSMLTNMVQSKVNKELKEKSTDSANSYRYLTGLQGLTDQSKDIDVFRELFPIDTPMFELFYEYQMVYGMIPEVAKCMDILRNAVLSADNFTKNFLIARYDDTTSTDSSIVTSDSQNIVSEHVEDIENIITEYDLNSLCKKYIHDAMKYGAKPVLVLPIDDNFRLAAEKILKTESTEEFQALYNGAYSDGTSIAMESGDSKSDKDISFSVEFEHAFDDLVSEYETVLAEEETEFKNMYSDSDPKYKDIAAVFEDRKKVIEKCKSKDSKKEQMKLLESAICKVVNKNVKFSIASESAAFKSIRKIAMQTKTLRFVKESKKRMRKGITLEGMTFESIYSDPIILNEDVDLICKLMGSGKHEIKEDEKTKYENASNFEDVNNESYEDLLYSYKKAKQESREDIIHQNEKEALRQIAAEDAGIDIVPNSVTPNAKSSIDERPVGSIIIPLPPDTVIPISVYGKHMGYYIIERTGSDDLGSGVASLLGYRPPNAMYAIGASGHLYTGNGALTGMDGAGIILKDMTDIPMNAKNDARRYELLRNMLTRAISERIKNPDIVDDKAFNSIIYSLIKDEYITNREVRVTYVPEYMMVYFAHEIDPDNGVGISVLQKGLFFAHIYIAALITNIMIAIARSADREQINVEVGTNNRIEATVQKVMRSLQTKRASIDSIGNVDTIMKALGTFQRFISLRHNGTPLIETETIPGQQVDIQNSLMDWALKSIVNSFDVPHSALNILDDAEYARSIALSNSMFLTKVVELQGQYQACCTKLGRLLVRNKYPEKILSLKSIQLIKDDKETTTQNLIDVKKVFLDLPSPQGLNVTALNDLLSTVTQFIDTINDIIIPTDIPEDRKEFVKTKVKKELLKIYIPNIPYNKFDDIVETANKEVISDSLKPTSQDDSGMGGDSSNYDSGSSGGFGSDTGMGGGEEEGESGGSDSEFNF